MIVYLDSSVLARAYLPDETGHAEAIALLTHPDVTLITGTWTRVEVTSALSRAARAGRGTAADLLRLFASDISPDGPITVISAEQSAVESRAMAIATTHAIRALDALHLAVAEISFPALLTAGDPRGFASRDEAQATAATALGYELI